MQDVSNSPSSKHASMPLRSPTVHQAGAFRHTFHSPPRRRPSSVISPGELYTARITRAVLTKSRPASTKGPAQPVRVSVLSGRSTPSENGSCSSTPAPRDCTPRRAALAQLCGINRPSLHASQMAPCRPASNAAPSPAKRIPTPLHLLPQPTNASPEVVISPAPPSAAASAPAITTPSPVGERKQLSVTCSDSSPQSSDGESFFCRGLDSPLLGTAQPRWALPSPSPLALGDRPFVAPNDAQPTTALPTLASSFLEFGQTPLADQFPLSSRELATARPQLLGGIIEYPPRTPSSLFNPAFSFGQRPAEGFPQGLRPAVQSATGPSPRTKRILSNTEEGSPSKRQARATATCDSLLAMRGRFCDGYSADGDGDESDANASHVSLVSTDSFVSSHPFASPEQHRGPTESVSSFASSASTSYTTGTDETGDSGVSWFDVMHDELWPAPPPYEAASFPVTSTSLAGSPARNDVTGTSSSPQRKRTHKKEKGKGKGTAGAARRLVKGVKALRF